MKKFYRVSNEKTGQGLWYKLTGEFTGLIHNEFNFCSNRELAMEYDKELVGFLSAVENLDDLWAWFSEEDVKRLQNYGFYIHEYEVTNFKWYEKFSHWVIDQKTSKLIKRITLL